MIAWPDIHIGRVIKLYQCKQVGDVDRSDFRIYTDDRRVLTIEDPVRITGKFEKSEFEEGDTLIYISVEKVE